MRKVKFDKFILFDDNITCQTQLSQHLMKNDISIDAF
jgi:hypothetical protein